MENERYILTLISEKIFKEVDIFPDIEMLKIGTTPDCDVKIKFEQLGINFSFVIYKTEKEFVIRCSDWLTMSTNGSEETIEIKLEQGIIISVADITSKSIVMNLAFSYDYTANAVNFNRIIDISSSQKFIIGSASNSSIKLKSSYFKNENLIISNKGDKIFVDAGYAPRSAFINGVRLTGICELKEMDFIGVAGYSFYYKNKRIYACIKDGNIETGFPVSVLHHERGGLEYPYFSRSPRMKYVFDTSDIEILNPPEKPSKPQTNLVLQLAPALLMMGVVALTRSGLLSGISINSNGYLIFSLASMFVGILTTISTFIYNRKKYKKNLEEWHKDYTDYIDKKRAEIEENQAMQLGQLNYTYPSLRELREFVKTFDGRLFERTPLDEDFLHIRIGSGKLESLRKITWNKDNKIKVANELAGIPESISKEYSYVNEMPVCIHLKESTAVGVIGNEKQRYEFFKSLSINLCITHSFEEVKLIVMIPENKQKEYEWVKWLPHIQDSCGNFRGIIYNEQSRENVLEFLYTEIVNRLEGRQEEESLLPHYVIVSLEEYSMKTHAFWKFSGKAQKAGFSFIFCREFKELLPDFCEEIIELSDNGGLLRKKNDKEYCCEFVSENIGDDVTDYYSERLAPIFFDKITLSSKLSTFITTFELLNILKADDLDLNERWSNSDVTKSLRAVIGKNAKGETVNLDIHEKAHGPHGLVAGTTGSGKSEILQSYILSAAVNFPPDQVAFVIIDFKAGGMANKFENLPHLIGKITDIDGNEINRYLLSIRAELDKRKRLFALNKVDHIDKYIEKYRNGEVDIPLPHLILIVDEFAELKAEHPEFMKEIISASRIGRSLGIHLILSTQKPSGQVNEQIWSNSRFKICLKVATREDSNEVLKSPLAADLRDPGRAYIQIGNNEIFGLFQSGYAGASANTDIRGSAREFVISEVDFSGKKKVIYAKRAEVSDDGKKISQLEAIVEHIDRYCREYNVNCPASICMPPLEKIIDYIRTDNDSDGISLGVYDDPCNQRQPLVNVDLNRSNLLIAGSSQTGKTNILQTIIRNIAERYTPVEAAIYIMDFASLSLRQFDKLNHVGGVVTAFEDEKLKNLFKLISDEIYRRKTMFFEAKKDIFTHIYILVDNINMFRQELNGFEDRMLDICKEGASVGITVVATCNSTSGLSYKFFGNFAERIAMNCIEETEYSNIFTRCRMRPKNIAGRGLVQISKEVFEFQSYLAFDGISEKYDDVVVRTEEKRSEQITEFVNAINNKYPSMRAKPIPEIPGELNSDYFSEMNTDSFVLPVGLYYSSIEPLFIDLLNIGALGIIGRKESEMEKICITSCIINRLIELSLDNIDSEVYIIDDHNKRFQGFKSGVIREHIHNNVHRFSEVIAELSGAAEERKRMLDSGKSLDDMSLIVCIISDYRLYEEGSVTADTVNSLKKLIQAASRLKMCFIFHDVPDRNEQLTSFLIAARSINRFLVFDNMENSRLLRDKASVTIRNSFRKPISVCEGYYVEGNDISKVKIIKE